MLQNGSFDTQSKAIAVNTAFFESFFEISRNPIRTDESLPVIFADMFCWCILSHCAMGYETGRMACEFLPAACLHT